MKRFFTWFFSRREVTISWLSILWWWEVRRIPYNIVLGIIAMIGFALLGVCLWLAGVLKSGDLVDPIALVMSPIFLNIAYTGGWVCEILLRLFWRKAPPSAGPILLKVGFSFSVLVIAALLATSLVPIGHIPFASKDELVPIAAIGYDDMHPFRYRCECLTNDYGFFMNWTDNAPPEIYLYQTDPATVVFTASDDDLLTWLSGIPEGTNVDWISSCGSTRGGMPPATSGRIQEIVQERCLHLTDREDGNWGFCVCESLDTRMFKSLNEAREWMKEHPEAAYWVAGRRTIIRN